MRLPSTIVLLIIYGGCLSQTLKQMDYFDDKGEIFLKLYKKEETSYLYFETWTTNGNTAVIHWGRLGTKGESKELKATSNSDLKTKLNIVISKMVSDGYAEIPIDHQYTIAITFKLSSWGTTQDLERREQIRSILTEHLGWTGNGRCDDGDIGSGEMTLYADVIEPYVGAKSIKEEFKLNNVTESYQFTIIQGDSVLHANYSVD